MSILKVYDKGNMITSKNCIIFPKNRNLMYVSIILKYFQTTEQRVKKYLVKKWQVFPLGFFKEWVPQSSLLLSCGNSNTSTAGGVAGGSSQRKGHLSQYCLQGNAHDAFSRGRIWASGRVHAPHLHEVAAKLLQCVSCAVTSRPMKASGCDRCHPSSDPWTPSFRRCVKYLLTSENALKLSLGADGVYFVISLQQLSNRKYTAVHSRVSVSL